VLESRRGRVLVVDDSHTMRSWLSEVIGTEFEVRPVATISLATASLQSGHFDVIVADYELQDGNGLDFLEQVIPRHPGVAGILLTAHREYERVRELQRAGRFLVLFKPTDPKELLAWIRNAVTMSRLNEATAKLRESGSHRLPKITPSEPDEGRSSGPSSKTRRLPG
jgi:two-component system response regulator HydG